MTTKVKEFKGSLNPIFNADIKNGVEDSLLNHVTNPLKDYLFINQIKPRSDQPRKIFNESSLEELAQSIKSKGIIQPIIVRETANGLYEIIVGERRWRAAQKAGLEKIPAIIREYNKSDGMAIALIENIQRENLNALEEAQAIENLLEEHAMTHNQVAESIGKSRTAVSNLLRLLTLVDEVKKMIHLGLIEMGHARALLTLTDEQQIQISKLVVQKNLSVRETEKLAQQINITKEKQIINIDPLFERKVESWKTSLSNALSSKVNVHFGSEGKGKVVIHFNSVEEVDWLMEHIKITEMNEM